MSTPALPSALVQFGLTNAALVVLMSLAVLVITQWSKNAHLHALLWLLVLLKLLAPPLIPLTYIVETEPIKAVAGRPSDKPQTPMEQSVLDRGAIARDGSWNTLAPPLVSMPLDTPAGRPRTSSLEPTLRTTGEDATIPSGTALAAFVGKLDTATVLLMIWLSGAALVLSSLIVQGYRFHRATSAGGMQDPSGPLMTAFEVLCRSMRFRRIPRFKLVCARVSPVAWNWAGRTTILFPAELTEKLSFTQQQMVLAHELAHARRRDLIVRWIELFVQSLYWWFVPLRWIRRRLHAAQEACCDAMVNRHFVHQQGAYGETLLAVASWLSEEHRPPVWASSFGRRSTLKARIQMMLEHPPARPLSRTAWTLAVTLGLLALITSVRWVTAEAPKNSVRQTSPLRVDAAKKSDGDSADLPASSVTGRVVDPEGQPLAGVWLIVRDGNINLFAQYGDGLIPRSDEDGRFDLGEVTPGRRRVTAFSLDWALETVVVDFPSDEPIEIKLRKGQRVEFRAVDIAGEPIPGIVFHPEAPRYTPFHIKKQANSPVDHSRYLHALDFLSHRYLLNNTTDENGVFVWENAPQETLYYQIYGKDYLSHPGGDFGPDGSPHTLVFRRRIPVTGRVVDAETGEAIPDFEVRKGTHFKNNAPGLWTWSEQGIATGEPGRFEHMIMNLGRTVRYRVDAKGYQPQVSRILDPEDIPDPSVALEFALLKDMGFAGVALTTRGQPAVGAQVYLCQRDLDDRSGLPRHFGAVDLAQDNESIETDAQGRFQVPPQDSPYLCLLVHEAGYLSLMDVDLRLKPVVTLRPWSGIEGHIFVVGKAAAGIPVTLSRRDSTAHGEDVPIIQDTVTTTTDAEGRYRFDRLVAGQWELRVVYGAPPNPPPGFIARGHQLRMPVTLLAGQSLTQDLGRTGVTVSGRVELPAGLTIDESTSRAYLNRWEDRPARQLSGVLPTGLRRSRVSVQTVPLESDGSFRFINVELSEHELSIHVAVDGKHPIYEAYEVSKTFTTESFRGTLPQSTLNLGELHAAPAVQ